MTTSITLAQWVPTFLRWYPLRHGVVVGASQQALGHLNAAPQALTVFKAHAPNAKASPQAANSFDWLIAAQNGPTTLYQASLPSESGLLPPLSLKACWPGIQCVGQHELQARTLDAALHAVLQTAQTQAAPNWLWVGSVPAAPVLAGATQLLQQAEVLAVRVTLHPEAAAHAGLETVQTLLAAQGLVLCGIEPERNPQLGTALFVRDHASAHAQTRQQLSASGHAQAQLQAKLQAESQALQAEAKAKTEAMAQRDALTKDNAELQAKFQAETQARQAEAAAKADMAQQRDELTHAQAQLQAKLQAESQALQAEVQAKTQAIAQRDALSKDKADLQAKLQDETQARQAEAAAKAAIAQQRDELTQAQAQLQAKLDAESQALQAEVKAKTEAIAKAEALTKSNDQSQAQLKAAQAELLQAKTHAEQLAQAHDQQLEKEKAQAAQQIDAVVKDKDQAASQLKLATSDLDTHKKRSADLQKQVDSSLNRLVKLQIAYQSLQATSHSVAQLQSGLEAPANKDQQPFQPKVVAEFNLGEAWAGNTVNTVIFRHHGIFTHQGHQFTSFYVDEKTLRFVCRRLLDNHITHYDLAGEYNPKDAHNSISMGVDRQGHLHACFDHHATKLRYRRSLQPMSIDGWTDDLPMTGQHENQVTYPTFILPRGDYPLTLLYRDGTHNKGSARLKYYNEKSQSWQDKPTPILSGADQKPWTSNAYWNHPAIGSDGSLHLSFVWRTGVLGDEQLVNNINIGYAWSPDNGHHWYTLQGQPYQVPITPTTAETIWPVPPGSNLINQCSMALDSFNRPHIVFYANDAEGIPQYQHLRYDGKRWHHQMLSERTEPFILSGGGTLQIPISRPEVLIDDQDNALVLFRGDFTEDRMAVTRLCAPVYAATDAAHQMLSAQTLGFAEPLLDREGWRQNQKLTLLTQHNHQPNHDANPKFASSAIGLCEFDL